MRSLENKKSFYVYAHKTATNGDVFYIGKGSGSRAKSKSGRNRWWRNIVKKHGYNIEILKDGLTNDEACRFEVETIRKLRESGINLCNVSSGGESGLAGIPLTEEHKEKLRMRKLGVKQSKEHAKKSATAKLGKPQPRDAVEKMVEGKRKMVINSLGEVFPSATAAAKAMAKRHGVYPSQGNISMACRGERELAYGYAWSYEIEKTPTIKEDGNKLKKRILCSNGMVFNSVSEAVKWVSSWRGSAAHQCLSACARGETITAYGFKWSYIAS